MDSGKISARLQIGGQFAVLAGWLFVGLQLMQDRQIATVVALHGTVNQGMYWAELVGQSPETWSKGLAGEPLSVSEAEVFDALASAWEVTHFSAYYTSIQIGVTPGQRFVREWASELHTHPGLLVWWQAFQQRMDYTNPTFREDDVWHMQIGKELSKLQSESPIAE